jgi:hypothetical protein
MNASTSERRHRLDFPIFTGLGAWPFSTSRCHERTRRRRFGAVSPCSST